MKLNVFCRNLISKGEIDGVPLTIGNYQFEYDVELDKISSLFTIKNLNIGLKTGFTIEKILFDGFPVSLWRDFLSFEMTDNPYVDNQLLEGENDIRFNGTMRICINSKKIYFNPWATVNGWIYNQNLHSCTNDDGCYHGEKNHHIEQFISLPYRKDIFYNSHKKTNYLVLGCSVTYGIGIEKNKIWPNLITKKNINLSCPGFGVDSIYITLKKALQEFSFDKVIILFPSLSRRLMKIKNINTVCLIPVVPALNMNSPIYKNNYYGMTKDHLSLQVEKTKRKIVSDLDNIYSKKFLNKISRIVMPENLFVSSWDKNTYKILSNYFVNILPVFALADLANDNQHPGAISHENWVKSINSFI
jgi:hypothetical protein